VVREQILVIASTSSLAYLSFKVFKDFKFFNN